MATALPAIPRRERYGTLRGSALILAFVILYVGFWVIWDSKVSGKQEVRPGTTIAVADDVSFVPADGWALEKEATTPGQSAAVVRGASAFSVATASWMGTLDEYTAREKKLFRASKVRLYPNDQSFHTGNGLTGVKFSYFTSGAEGILWIAYDPEAKTVVTLNGQSAAGSLPTALGQFQEMVNSVRTGAGK
ncbi:hypothetical protein OG728_00815 [Streptomyces microflavus]|uniref:hypothetical protein n=1 Tax=Streptomyces TaxID=1883 RepID=UPI0019148F48|nr:MULTISPECIES: hypothetical protein [Streptomyces]MBK5994985.1 hypothetical protein [Streptomyces sp. MBT58]WSR89065.1 hypothetical protein OG728_00815 [Streptomyces microflavus]